MPYRDPEKAKANKREYHRKRYNTSLEYRAHCREIGKVRTKKWAEWLTRYKKEHPCTICGEADFRCLDFHHRDPSMKEFCIGRASSYSHVRVLEEIAKCDVLCSNCHRKAEWTRLKNPGTGKREPRSRRSA